VPTLRSFARLSPLLAGLALAGGCQPLDQTTAPDEAVEVRTGAVSQQTVRVDVGSNTSNGLFAADTGFSGGTQQTHAEQAVSTAGVTNPAPAAAYQSGRIGNYTYTFGGFTPGMNGVIRLHFAETFWTSSGKRVFNVYVNNTKVLFDYDIFAAALGQWKAVVAPITAAANASGQFVIKFETVKDNAWVSAIEILPPPACANGAAAQAFGSDMWGCPGAVTFANRATVCGAGYHVATPIEWATWSGGVAPTHNYWTDENLTFSGNGSNDCSANTNFSGTLCGTTPMRVCTPGGTDAEGNQCNWTNCGLDSKGPNLYFGGCSGNTTAGALCVRSVCANGEAAQSFGGGLVGCPGSVTQDNAKNLCAAGYHIVSSREWVEMHSTLQPTHNYWTYDKMPFVRGASGSCVAESAASASNTACASNMHLCTPGGTDAEGNQCGTVKCGITDAASNQYVGGCSAASSTAGALCLHGYPQRFFQGDEGAWNGTRTGACNVSPWPGGVVYYELWNSDADWQSQVVQAMNKWVNATNNLVSFQASTTRTDRVVIRCAAEKDANGNTQPPSTACVVADGGGGAQVGYGGGLRSAFITKIDKTWLANHPNQLGFSTHEIGHVIGFPHEQVRADRDRYIHVLPNGLTTASMGDVWTMCGPSDPGGTYGVYDFNSTMHYMSGEPGPWGVLRTDLQTVFTTGMNVTNAKDASNAREAYGYQRAWTKFFPVQTDPGGHTPLVQTIPSPPASAANVKIQGRPVVTSQGGWGNLDVYVRGTDGHVYHRYLAGNNWYGYDDMGSPFDTDPAATSLGAGTSIILAGRSGRLYMKQYASGAWGAWSALPVVTSALAAGTGPAVIPRGAGKLSAFHRGTDGKIYQSDYASGAWGGWTALPAAPAGQTFAGSPGAAAPWSNIYDVFATTTSGRIYRVRSTNGVWSAWELAVGNASATDSPAAASWGPGRVDLVYKGTDGWLNWTYSWAVGSFIPAVSIGGQLGSSPSAVASRAGRIDVVSLGTDGGLWWRFHQRTPGDFDGDGRADPAYFRGTDKAWHIKLTTTGNERLVVWGETTDKYPVADYDGDGKSDVGLFRPTGTLWYPRFYNEVTPPATAFGNATDRPIPGDYDKDGRADLAMFRPSTGHWLISLTKGGSRDVAYGGTSTDIVTPGDYDGDGEMDLSYFRPSDHTWHVSASGGTAIADLALGDSASRPVPGDYDGDGRTDRAVFAPSTGVWTIRFSSSGTNGTYTWGGSTDIVVPADYDGDGRTDPAIYRPSEGNWWILPANGNAGYNVTWGNSTDTPVTFRTPQ
jgi:hypothetical protein